MKKIITLFIVLLFAGIVQAQTSPIINESETKVFSEPNRLRVNLATENASKDFRVRLRLEILDANDRVLARNDSLETIESGKDVLQIPVMLAEKTSVRELLWNRLRYTLISNKNTTSGIISLSEIMPELFELRVSASRQIYAGMRFPARVRAFHPTKNAPIPGIKINAELKLELATGNESDELKINAAGETDADGFAVVEFQIPGDVKFSGSWGGEIKVTGEKNGLISKAQESLRTDNNRISVLFLTDKPLYQPNQKIYARGLALQSGLSDAAMTVAADKELEFSIKDEENTVLFRQTVKTSRFGIAAIEWQIPESAKLGTYKIIVKAGEQSDTSETSFKVSRYDLPNFVVKTKSDKDFYLPEQTTAEITIDALYLFGKPVASGKVKVVREGKRVWNYLEQKWDIQEEETYEGETDAEGKYVAKIDLSEAQENLKATSEAFRDLNFAAYFTDSSTNKTEQRRFDLRVTKEPVHVYLTGKKYGENNPKLPLTLYVSTYSADGKPLACETEIKGNYENDGKPKTLAKVKTNSLGAGKVEFFAPKREDGVYDKNLELKITARDAENRTGAKDEEIEIDANEKQLLVRTDKAIYRQGEPVKIEILSTDASENVFVDISKKLSSIESRQIKLKNGRGSVKIPYNADFKNYLTVAAYFDNDGEAVTDTKGVIYPTPKNLSVEAVSTKDVFRPNEEATVNFSVSSPDKTRTETALGIVVLDKAVEERAKTDADFGATNIFQSFGDFLPGKFDRLDMKQPVSPEIQLSAEMTFYRSYYNPGFFNSNYAKNLEAVFAEQTRNQFQTVNQALRRRFEDKFEHPTDDVSLRKILSEERINFDELRDPWGNAYRAEFSVYFRNDVIEIKSAGANKIFGDRDDFTAQRFYFEYFKPLGVKIEKAAADYYKKTGKIIRDAETLRQALQAEGVNLDAIKDRWGEPYRIEFGMNGRYFTTTFLTGGADKKFSGNYYYNDFAVWTSQVDYIAETESKIEKILNRFLSEKKTFPKNEDEFKAILREGGVDFDALRDGWNRPFYIETETVSRVVDRMNIENSAKQGEPSKEIIAITPVTQQIAIFRVRSLGANGVKDKDYYSDYPMSVFAGLVSEKANSDKPKITVPKVVISKGKSVIYGVVKDSNESLVANANITVINNGTRETFETKTNAEGVFLQANLSAGRYTVKANSSGFKTSVISDVNVELGGISQANLTLEAGLISETVIITPPNDAVTIDASDTKIDTNITRQVIDSLPRGTQFSSLLMVARNVRPEALSGGFQIDGASGSENVFVVDGQEVRNFRSVALNEDNDLPTELTNEDNGLPTQKRTSTPRLREYFPETLLWQPELITDANGNAELKFRLADNITTWKIYAIASDTKGKIGVTEKEIRAFQPFFVDLEPPKILTEGDEIFLPVQVRNYTKEKQTVNVEMAQGDWFNLLGAGNQQIEVNPNASQNAVFGFRAAKATDDGRQKVTAIAQTDSDAIEKPVVVKPNGQEIVKTQSETFNQTVSMDVNFPENALPNTQKAELKIYPNLFSHVTESVEGLLRRPYGCGEQTISSTYPNLMVLKFTKNNTNVRQTAQKYLKKGYERLLGYHSTGGGFTYWGKGEPNLALTAYAYRFLTDAKEFIAVDESILTETRDWLVKKQNSDGNFEMSEMQTAYLARTLARNSRDEKSNAALKKSLEFLKQKTAKSDDAYTLALFGLASVDAGNIETAREIAQKLEKMTVTEGDTISWKLETNTPFYGWGNTGRIETTALVLQLLMREAQTQKTENAARNDLIQKATLFLLKNKDRYGVWYSTQTTINVLDTFLAAISENKTSRNQNLQISLNGENLQTVEISPDQIAPVIVDLTAKLNPTANRLDIQSSGLSPLTAQVVATHYIDWKDSEVTNGSRQIRLDYKCDRTEAEIMQEITCSVEAEKTTGWSYGMLLAEIGLPPGADVSRESLQKAMEADWSLSRYDILPDRIIVYLWSKPGGTKFNFKFKPRYGINAQTPASFVYDYYNEEAKATVVPMRFSVK